MQGQGQQFKRGAEFIQTLLKLRLLAQQARQLFPFRLIQIAQGITRHQGVEAAIRRHIVGIHGSLDRQDHGLGMFALR